ncbi:MAG TPA: hypothetical protein VFM10_04390, partial [Terriglobales bacterium]|nr:hypothetical protein [Terriglobales bacterium]
PEMIAAWRERQPIQQMFSAYSDALVAQDFQRAYSYHSAEFQQQISYASFVQYQHDVRARFGTLNNVERRGSTIQAWRSPKNVRAVIVADFHYAKGTVRFTCQLRREGGKWTLLNEKGDEQ